MQGSLALLSPPMSSPPVPPANRRKTLAGMTIARTVGYSLRRASARIRARHKAMSVARAAETLVCRSLGIIKDGEEITEQAMDEFARRFQGEVPDHVIAALRVLFKVDSPEEDGIEKALLNHGGDAALDNDEVSGENATVDV